MKVDPLSRARTRRVHRAAVEFHQIPDDREAQTEARVRPRRRAVGLAKPVEDMRQEFPTDPLAGIDDADLGGVPEPLDRHRDAAPARGEFDGIGDEVPDDLLSPSRIAGHRPRRRGPGPSRSRRAWPPRLARRRRPPHRRLAPKLTSWSFRRRLELQTKTASDDPRYVEQIVDQPGLRLGVPINGLHERQERGRAPNGSPWRPGRQLRRGRNDAMAAREHGRRTRRRRATSAPGEGRVPQPARRWSMAAQRREACQVGGGRSTISQQRTWTSFVSRSPWSSMSRR